MIQEFSVQNFLSFRDKQTISFLATSDKTLSEELIFEPKPGIRLLRLAMIYGANASGKSNLLRAFQAVWTMLFSSTNKEHEEITEYQPFELTKGEPTLFEILFWANGRRYQYELKYNRDFIVYEKLMYSSDENVMSLLYERKEGEFIQFGGTTGIKAKQRDDLNKETLRNHTVLSTLDKKNIDVPVVIRELYEWIKANVHELGIYNDGLKIAEQAEANPAMKKLILELLNKADFNIADFYSIGIAPSKEILDGILNNNDLSNYSKRLLLRLTKQVVFKHQTQKEDFQISFGLESAGTRVYFRLARLLFDLRKSSCILMEDELEDSLHYDLLIHYLKTYLETSGQSQLIFTTHNLLLLDEDWMIRRDMVWFTEKDRNTASTLLYRASDMGIHKNVSLMNAYRIGKLGAKPILGSTLLNPENL